MPPSRREELARLRAVVQTRARVREQRIDARAARQRVLDEIAAAAAERRRCQVAVNRLTRGPLGWVRRWVAKREALAAAEQALAGASASYDGLASELSGLDLRIDELTVTLSRTALADVEYTELLEAFERAAIIAGSPYAPALVQFAASEGRLRAAREALEAALSAGSAAQRAVSLAQLAAAVAWDRGVRRVGYFPAFRRPWLAAMKAVVQLQRSASGAAAIIPGIRVTALQQVDLAPAAVSLPNLDLAGLLARLERAVAAVSALVSDLTFHEQEIRRAEATLVADRERAIDLERDRL